MGRGTYDENQSPKSQGTLAREAFFWEYAMETRNRFPNLILMLTGGFRSRKGVEAALGNNVCDLVGIGRPAVVEPEFPRLIMSEISSYQDAKLPLKKVAPPPLSTFFQIRAFGGGAETVSTKFELLLSIFLQLMTFFSAFTLGRFAEWLQGSRSIHLRDIARCEIWEKI